MAAQTPRFLIRLTTALTITLITLIGGSASAQTTPDLPDGRLDRVTERIRKSEYDFTVVPGDGWSAANRAANLRTRVSAEGIEVTPRSHVEPGWVLGLRLTRFGRSGVLQDASPATLSVQGNRIELDRSALVEWYVNDDRGLEQGFRILQPPGSPEAGPLLLEMSIDGILGAILSEDGQTISFRGPDGADVLNYGELHVFDASGAEVQAWLDVDQGRVQISIADAGAQYPLDVDPILTTPTWSDVGGQAGANFGFSVSTAGDVNGDGFSDIIIGAYLYDAGQLNEGRAFVYHGSPSGPSVTADWTAESNQLDAQLGYSVATAGDVNGDGFDDVIVGIPELDSPETNEGSVYLYIGSPTGLFPAPFWTHQRDQAGARFGASVATAGDVNGDGYNDILVGAPDSPVLGAAFLFLGSSTGPSSGYNWGQNGQFDASYGHAVASAGDVNGDGFDDVVIGEPGFDLGVLENVGRAQLYLGSSTGLLLVSDWTRVGDVEDGVLGWAVGTAGDVDADGYAELLVGSQGRDSGASVGGSEGRVELFAGSAAGLSVTPTWFQDGFLVGERFGCSVGTAGDVNGDGFADVVIGAFGFANPGSFEGAAYLYEGFSGGLSGSPTWSISGDSANTWLGYSVGTAGDVNGDGYSDLIIGSFQYDGTELNEGRATVHYGAPDTAQFLSTFTIFGASEEDELGARVAPAGDVDGDGFGDILVGIPGFDPNDQGRAQLHRGSADGPELNPSWVVSPGQADVHFGTSFGSAGDVNGDGFDDVIVGAALFDGPAGQDSGVSVLYLGSAGGLNASEAWLAFGDEPFDQFGASVAAAGDVNGDGLDDILIGAPGFDGGDQNEGHVRLHLGTPTGVEEVALWSFEGGQVDASIGSCVGTAGDVDGDGLSDIVIGAPLFDGVFVDGGAAFLFPGSTLGVSPVFWSLLGSQTAEHLGSSIATAGDVDRDGFSDVIIGSPGYDVGGDIDAGRAVVYHGSVAGLETSPQWVQLGNGGENLGAAVATAGDINGDGFSDVLVGAPLGSNFELHHGSDSGVGSPSWTIASYELQGTSVAAAGDVNGDGFGDFIVGAPGADSVLTDRGVASIYFGNSVDSVPRRPQQAQPNDTSLIARGGRSESETEFRLRLRAHSPSGRAKVGIQWEIKPLGTPLDGTGLVMSPSGLTDTGVPDPTDGSYLEFSELVSGLAAGGSYHWRTRVVTDSPFFPHSPWFTLSLGAWSETHVRTHEDPASVSGLICELNGSSIQLIWQNGAIYDSIEVRRNGVVLDTLPGDATSYLDGGPGPGSHTYAVTATQLGSPALPATCIVNIPVPPVTSLECTQVASDTQLTWSNGAAYDSIEIARDGASIATLPGSAESHLDPLPGYGAHTYTVTGMLGGAAAPGVGCNTGLVPPSPEGLLCTVVTGGVQVSWQNPTTYDVISIDRNGVLLYSVPGNISGVFDPAPGIGQFIYDVTGWVGPVPSLTVSCAVELTPLPVSNLMCEQIDPCNCSQQLTWVNQDSYDEIHVLENGVIVAILPGIATSTVLDSPTPGASLCIRPFSAMAAAPDTCCIATCNIDPPIEPSDLVCLDSGSCEATLTWQNSALYSTIRVLIDGVTVATLPGGEEMVLIPLGTPGNHEVCLVAETPCGDLTTEVCCQLTCAPDPGFRRGDGNDDGTVNVADPIYNLAFLFSTGPSVCLDAQDTNDDGQVNIADPIFGLTYLFAAGPPPSSPFPTCGPDPTDDLLGCATSPGMCP